MERDARIVHTKHIDIWGRGSEKGPSAYYKNFQEGASNLTLAIEMYA